MLDGEGMVRAWPLEQLFKVIGWPSSGYFAILLVGGGPERVLAPPLVLFLPGAVGGAFAGIVVSPRLALGAIKNCSHRLLARSMAHCDVEEFLGGPRALAP